MTDIRLAFVEDEGLFRELLRSALAPLEGLHVVGDFGSAAQALRELPALEPDVVLMDINLGVGSNGVELGLSLRKTLPKLGVVLFSNQKDPGYLTAIPESELPGFSYLLKTSVRNLAALERAIRGVASGFVILDPEIVGHSSLPQEQPERFPTLSERQRSLLLLLAQGYSNVAIGQELGLSDKTVENQLGGLYRLLEIDTSSTSRHPRVAAALAYLRGTISG